ncbi:MAG: alcohol dehydrogenase catalytic domain-containing protein [Lachnospiraceae bacterium]|jgi:threonine dehydrogenase-like Zn-dependent dehydrogenase|nr:alcohol dehydrogenase catalytic domain-containing protein [Lachnospiraceae bacterium]
MKGIYFDGKRAEYRKNLPMPKRSDTESLIRILYAGVCSTDREILKGYRPDFYGIMGHEFVGIVEESPDLELIGKMVVGELNAGCGHCIYCQTGREKHCENRRVIGMDGKDGCFAEYMTLETHLLHRVPSCLGAKEALLTEPLAAALEILSQVHIRPDVPVGIIGDGRLAYLIAGVLQLSGVRLTIFGKHEKKLEEFEVFGQTRLAEEIAGLKKSPYETFELVVEASGSPSGLEMASVLVRRQGMILLKSTYAGRAQVDMSQFVVNEITIKGSRCGPFEPALRLLEKGLVKLPPAEFYSMEEWEKAFASKAFKAGFVVE